jgi:hypothetical protein
LPLNKRRLQGNIDYGTVRTGPVLLVRAFFRLQAGVAGLCRERQRKQESRAAQGKSAGAASWPMRPARAAKTAAEVRMAVQTLDAAGVARQPRPQAGSKPVPATSSLPGLTCEHAVGLSQGHKTLKRASSKSAKPSWKKPARRVRADTNLQKAIRASLTEHRRQQATPSPEEMGSSSRQCVHAGRVFTADTRTPLSASSDERESNEVTPSPIPPQQRRRSTPETTKNLRADKKQKKQSGLALNHLPPGFATWVGDSVGTQGTCQFYECFAKNGHLFHVNDCVYVQSERRDKASYILQVKSMWQNTKNSVMYFRGLWLYRPQVSLYTQSQPLCDASSVHGIEQKTLATASIAVGCVASPRVGGLGAYLVSSHPHFHQSAPHYLRFLAPCT